MWDWRDVEAAGVLNVDVGSSYMCAWGSVARRSDRVRLFQRTAAQVDRNAEVIES